MLGYKIYFNGSKFVADNTATEVQTVPCDSTVSWMANKIYADNAVEKHNANDIKDVKKCKECGEYFWQTGVSYNKEKNMWIAYITVNYKTKYLGDYTDFNDAVNVRKEAEKKYGFTCDDIVADYDKEVI